MICQLSIIDSIPAPPIPETIQRPTFNLDVVMFIMEDGTVGQTRMLKGSGDAEWDSLAMASIKQWRFAPARMDNEPVGSWFHMQSTLRYADPQYMNLAEILLHRRMKLTLSIK